MSLIDVETRAARVARPPGLAQDVPLPARVCGECGEWLPHACAAADGCAPDRMRGAVQSAVWLSWHYQARRAGEASPRRRRRPRRLDRRRIWLRRDDVVDEVTVRRAAAGAPVQVSRAERVAAARLIIAGGGGPGQICVRLHVSGAAASRLYTQVTGRPPGPVGTGYQARVPA